MESSKVADITQHSWGRKDINLSEVEMLD